MVRSCILCGEFSMVMMIEPPVELGEFTITEKECCKKCLKAIGILNDFKKSNGNLSSGTIIGVKKSYNILKKCFDNPPQIEDQTHLAMRKAVYELLNDKRIYVIGEQDNIINDHAEKMAALWNEFNNEHMVNGASDLIVQEGVSFGWVAHNNHSIYFCGSNPKTANALGKMFKEEGTQDFAYKYVEKVKLANKLYDAKTVMDIIEIPIDKITLFKETGDIQYVSNTKGVGGGTNIWGAVAGGLLFGPAGAVIGSNRGTNITVETTTKTHDTRVIRVWYQDESNVTRIQNFPIETWDMFMELVPEKEETSLQLANQNNVNTQPNALPSRNEQELNAINLIKQYKELLDIGALTQEEFDAKKKQLLNL